MKRILSCLLALTLLALSACSAFAADSEAQQMEKLDNLRVSITDLGLMDWDEEVPGLTDQEEGAGYASRVAFGEFLLIYISEDPVLDATRYECSIFASGLPDGMAVDDVLAILVADVSGQVESLDAARDIVEALWKNTIPGEDSSVGTLQLDDAVYSISTSYTDSEVIFEIAVL